MQLAASTHKDPNSGAKLITDAAELEAAAAQLLQADAVAVDTEFFWERTFYPVLGLVQLATRDNSCWLVDAVRLPDLAALGPVMASLSVTKVLHDAPQDLGILARATGTLPRQIFDTRLAAGFANFDPTCSLQALLQQMLGVELCKAETRSDWLRRPLSPGQLRYAAEDVLHLLPLREHLLGRCAGESVRAWLQEEMARLEDPSALQDRDPQGMYLRVKGTARLHARQLSILREAAAWRELEARQRDWPRGHVLPDDALVAIARAAPVDLPSLASVPDLPRNMPEPVRASLLAAVTRGRAVPDADCPQPPRADFPSRRTRKPRTDLLLEHIRVACAAQSIHPALVASRSDAETYVEQLSENAAASHPLSHGWRKNLVAGFA
ncbi:MAG: HRDC domain-containing protein [bacterium]